MKFASALTVVFALASSTTCKADHEQSFLRGRTLNAEHDEMAFKKAKIITTKTLPDNSTITFYEPEEGIISVVHDSPPEAQQGEMSSSKATKSSQAGSIPETPGELFKILTGEDVVPKSLVVAETRMNKHNARRSLPPPPPPSESSDEDEQGMNDGETAVENDGGRNLVSCDKWEDKYCIKDAHGVSDYCKCFSCRTGNARVQYTSKATYSKAKPYRGSVNHSIWYFDRYWRHSVSDDVKEGHTNELWSYGDNSANRVYLEGKGAGWHWFVDFYDQDESPGYNIAPPRCSRVV